MTLHHVPAGVESYSDARVQITLRRKPNSRERTFFGQKYKRWNTLNSTIELTSISQRNGTVASEIADVAVPINSATYVANCGLTKVLANPIHGNYVKRPFAAEGIETILDSGGFQLLKSTVDFVHPDDVIARYNANADIGMPLDLPVPNSVEHLFWDAASKLIKANDEYILSKLNKNVDLALISHGTSLKLRERRLDVLDRKASVVAIAGLNIKPAPGINHAFNNAENLMYVLSRYRKSTRYFHVLGVTSKLWMLVYAIIDASGYVQSIGADSVSHRIGALSGFYDTMDFNQTTIPKGRSIKVPLSCNCPVCWAIDDERLMNNSILLEAHNLWVRARQADLISELAKNYVEGKIKLGEIHALLNLKLPLRDLHVIVDYVQEVMANKFRPIKRDAVSKTLFGKSVNKVVPERAAHIEQVIRSYEKFHKKRFLKG